MKKILQMVLCVFTVLLTVATLSEQAKFEGTYVLEDNDENRFKWKQPELTINFDEEGQYVATLTNSSGEVLLESKKVEVNQQEFKVIFTMSSDLGELELTFAGEIVDEKIVGSISESMFSSNVKLFGTRKPENEITPRENELENPTELSVVTDAQNLNPDLAGTYVLENKSNSPKKPELIIDEDQEGIYSATLIAGKVTETDDVVGKGNEFKATFTISTNLGDLKLSYAGRVKHGKLSGTITESMFNTEVELVGKLKDN